MVLLETSVEPVLQTAKSISEYGILVVIAAFMLVGMFILFKHFLNMFQDMFDKVSSTYTTSETPMEQIRVLQSVVFDLAKYTFLDHLERIYKENNLVDHEATKQKVQDVCSNMFADRKSKFDNFKYHGYSLSFFCDKKWIDKMTGVGMKMLYLKEDHFDIEQAFSAIDIAYNQIKIEFYNNIISKA